MDFQIGLIGVVIALISSSAIYIILKMSLVKEDSFEEAKANRRKIIKQYQDQSKTGVDKSKEKKVKKATKKSKKNETEDEAQPTKEAIVEAVEEKEVKKVIEEVKQLPKESDIKKPVKIEKGKKAHEGANTAVTGVVLSMVATKPALKPNNEKTQPPKSSKKKGDENKQRVDDDHDGSSSSSQIVEEPVKETVVQHQETVVKHVSKPSKKKRSELTTLHQLSNEKEAVNINLLVSLVQKAELSRTEIQLLIDALLNKQQEDISEWLKGRQDPQVKLQKQLLEAEQALKDEKQITLGFQAKLKELRNEINADKANARHNEELIVTIQNDCKNLSVKLQQSIEENQGLAAKIQQYQKQLSDEQITVRKLKDEQGIQQQITEKQCHDAVITLQAQVNQYAAQSQELQGANTSLRTEIAMLQENDLRIQEEYRDINTNLERALSSSTFEINKLRGELANAEHNLAESRKEVEKIDAVVRELKTENQHFHEQNKKYIEQCSEISKENENLKTKISENLENGYSCNNKQDIADYKARLEESSNSLESLKNEIEEKNKQIEDLGINLNSTKRECQKTKTLLENANREITSLQNKTTCETVKQDHEESITQLKNILNDKTNELDSINGELEVCKLKNNELRNKNWKLVEALTKAEQSLQAKLLNEQKNNTNVTANRWEVKVKTCLQRILKQHRPEVIIDDGKDSNVEEWLQTAEQALSSLSNPCELQSQNSQLQSLVQHYKTIINETEGMLNQLQNHVEIEESRWKEKLLTLEEELDLLKQQNKCEYSLQLIILGLITHIQSRFATDMDLSRRKPYSNKD